MSIRSKELSPPPTPHIKLGTSVNGEIMDQKKKVPITRDNKEAFMTWCGLLVEKKTSPLRLYKLESSHGFGVEIHSTCMVLKSSTLKGVPASYTLGVPRPNFSGDLQSRIHSEKNPQSVCSQSCAEVSSHLSSPVMTTWTFKGLPATGASLTASKPVSDLPAFCPHDSSSCLWPELSHLEL